MHRVSFVIERVRAWGGGKEHMKIFNESAVLVEALGKTKTQGKGKREKKNQGSSISPMANVHERDTPTNDMISMLTQSGAPKKDQNKTSTRVDAIKHLHVDELYLSKRSPNEEVC